MNNMMSKEQLNNSEFLQLKMMNARNYIYQMHLVVTLFIFFTV